MADTQTADTTQQVTSIAPPVANFKNSKRQAAGRAIAERTWKAREEQKQKLAEAEAIIAKERLKKAEEEARKAEGVVAPRVEAPVVPPATVPVAKAETKTLTTTNFLTIASIIVSLAALCYKRKEIRGAMAKIKAPAPVMAAVPQVVAPKRSGIRPMD